MSRAAGNDTEGLELSIGLTRLRVDVEAVKNVDGVEITTTKIRPADNGADSRSKSRSNLPAWLAASKVRMCVCARVFPCIEAAKYSAQ